MPIPEHILTPEEFLAAAENGCGLGRAPPGEYAAGHLPGAVSFPLFTDEERARVGTAYRQESKQWQWTWAWSWWAQVRDMAARARALFEAQETRTPLLVHCWRGGMRSGSVDWLLRTAEVPSARCQGGYKACRAELRATFQTARPYVVLGGMTGTAKTDAIHALAGQKERTLDLEGMARHFGSSFGNLDAHPQPSTEQFSNDLAWALRALDRDGHNGPVWVENESRSIGWVQMPEDFHKRLRSAPVLELERTEENRITHLLSMYGEADEEALVQAFERFAPNSEGSTPTPRLPTSEKEFDRGGQDRFGVLRQDLPPWIGQARAHAHGSSVWPQPCRHGQCVPPCTFTMEPMEPSDDIKLTQYSHGAGCGCKIAPAVLHDMLSGMKAPIIRNCWWGTTPRTTRQWWTW